jgi:hypothetical protein
MSLLNRIGATRAGTWLIAHVVSPVQRRLLVATRGRVSLTGKRPVLLLTATGRRSGRPRTIPLFFLRDGDDLREEFLERRTVLGRNSPDAAGDDSR